MIPTLTFLKYLLFMELGVPAVDYQTEHCFVMKSGSYISFGNRVCSSQLPSEVEIDAVINFIDPLPIRWFVLDSDAETISALQQKGMRQIAEFPAMIIDLDRMKEFSNPPGLEIKVITEAADIRTWVSILARSFQIDAEKFGHMIDYILARARPGSVTLHLAYQNGITVGTCMTIKRGEIVSVHWIGTLAEYRGKGIGTAVSSQPLMDARAAGCTQAILMATDLGKPVYDKLGYKEYARYKVFGK